MIKSFTLVLAAGTLSVAGCQTSSPPPSAAQKPALLRGAARATVDAITGNARGSRQEARALRQLSDEKLAARDYNGAMDARWKMLDVRPGKSSSTVLGSLVFFAIQDMALGQLTPIASQLDAASCRKYAAQLKNFDARFPSYTALLQRKKADDIKQLLELSRNPQEWQKNLAGLGFSPQEEQILQKMTVAQIQKNIEKLSDAAIARSKQFYSGQLIGISVDPYTKTYASPSKLQEFLHAKRKMERLLVVAALQKRADRLENKKPSDPLPADPFGRAALNTKGEIIYSVGPDTKDNGGQLVPTPHRVQIADKGDVPAPVF